MTERIMDIRLVTDSRLNADGESSNFASKRHPDNISKHYRVFGALAECSRLNVVLYLAVYKSQIKVVGFKLWALKPEYARRCPNLKMPIH